MVAYILLSCFVIAGYSWWIESRFLRVRRERVRDLSHRILLVTDLHIGWYSAGWWLRLRKRQFAKLRSLQPDIILIGGDIIDSNDRYLPAAAELIRELASWGAPVYAVLGNHDHDYKSATAAGVKDMLEQAGVVLLQNETAQLANHTVVGITDLEHDQTYSNTTSKESWRQRATELPWYQELNCEEPVIMFTHNPDGVWLPGDPRPKIVLAGHTHGGQMLPLQPLYKVVRRFLPKGSFGLWAGRRECNGSTLIVSRGVGSSSILSRFLCPAEVVLIEGKKA
jgi:uncharacterized protein